MLSKVAGNKNDRYITTLVVKDKIKKLYNITSSSITWNWSKLVIWRQVDYYWEIGRLSWRFVGMSYRSKISYIVISNSKAASEMYVCGSLSLWMKLLTEMLFGKEASQKCYYSGHWRITQTKRWANSQSIYGAWWCQRGCSKYYSKGNKSRPSSTP